MMDGEGNAKKGENNAQSKNKPDAANSGNPPEKRDANPKLGDETAGEKNGADQCGNKEADARKESGGDPVGTEAPLEKCAVESVAKATTQPVYAPCWSPDSYGIGLDNINKRWWCPEENRDLLSKLLTPSGLPNQFSPDFCRFGSPTANLGAHHSSEEGGGWGQVFFRPSASQEETIVLATPGLGFSIWIQAHRARGVASWVRLNRDQMT